mmetsp:Transcript_648/g.2040  ORF Transcript_648/g.2040 Transcript_648/m.2040 type:complete len:246 (+) Transcript_648:864-1601(+)
MLMQTTSIAPYNKGMAMPSALSGVCIATARAMDVFWKHVSMLSVVRSGRDMPGTSVASAVVRTRPRTQGRVTAANSIGRYSSGETLLSVLPPCPGENRANRTRQTPPMPPRRLNHVLRLGKQCAARRPSRTAPTTTPSGGSRSVKGTSTPVDPRRTSTYKTTFSGSMANAAMVETVVMATDNDRSALASAHQKLEKEPPGDEVVSSSGTASGASRPSTSAVSAPHNGRSTNCPAMPTSKGRRRRN